VGDQVVKLDALPVDSHQEHATLRKQDEERQERIDKKKPSGLDLIQTIDCARDPVQEVPPRDEGKDLGAAMKRRIDVQEAS